MMGSPVRYDSPPADLEPWTASPSAIFRAIGPMILEGRPGTAVGSKSSHPAKLNLFLEILGRR